MQVEHPIHEYHIRPFVGLRCGIILQDGSTHYGTVTGFEQGKLIVKTDSGAAAQAETLTKNGKTKIAKPSAKVRKTSAISTSFKLESVAALYALLP